MSTFKDRESKEQLTWTKFEAWLKRGQWNYRRFRYSKDLTTLNFLDIKTRQAVKKIDFKHDGIMARPQPPIETYLFDLKYKEKDIHKTLVNVEDYKAYYTLSNVIPFLIVVYIGENDRLYFHRVRNPEEEPPPYMYWNFREAKAGGQNYVYEMPEEEYCLISGFDTTFKPPKNTIDYLAQCRKIGEQFKAWSERNPFAPRPHDEYKQEVLEELQKGIPEPWSNFALRVPLASTYLKDIEKQLKRLSRQG